METVNTGRKAREGKTDVLRDGSAGKVLEFGSLVTIHSSMCLNLRAGETGMGG